MDTPGETVYSRFPDNGCKRDGKYYLVYTSYKDSTVYSVSNHPVRGWKQIPGPEASLIRDVSALEIYRTSDGKWYLSLITHPNGLHLLEMRQLIWDNSEKPRVQPME